MKNIDCYSPLRCDVDPKTKTIIIKYNDSIIDGIGTFQHLVDNCKVIAPFIDDNIKK